MATTSVPVNPEADARVKAVFDDIRATRNTDYINNLWQTLAFDPALLESTWAEVKRVMAVPSQLDPLTKEMVYIAVSVANACSYCVHSLGTMVPALLQEMSSPLIMTCCRGLNRRRRSPKPRCVGGSNPCTACSPK
jgi:alkylhydroperoxidase family enzyme